MSYCTRSELLNINVIHKSGGESYWFKRPRLGIHGCKAPNQSIEQTPSHKGLVMAITSAGSGSPRATSHPALLATSLPKLSWVFTFEQSPGVVFCSSSATPSPESSSENRSFWFIPFSLSGDRMSYCCKLNDACRNEVAKLLCSEYYLLLFSMFDHFPANSQNPIISGASLSH